MSIIDNQNWQIGDIGEFIEDEPYDILKKGDQFTVSNLLLSPMSGTLLYAKKGNHSTIVFSCRCKKVIPASKLPKPEPIPIWLDGMIAYSQTISIGCLISGAIDWFTS